MKTRLNRTLAWIASKQPELSSGSVYIVSCDGFVKIGVAGNVAHRVAIMQIGNPHPIKILKTIQSITPYALEEELHAQLEQYRVRGEWFKIPKDVLGVILGRK